MAGRRLIELKDDWENIPQELKDALAKALTSNSNGEENSDDYKYHVNDWIDGQKVNDAKFALYFLERHHMRCFHGVLFDMDGARSDSVIEQEIYSEIEPYVSTGIAKKARGLLDAIKIKAHVNEVEIQADRIHVSNGTFYLNGCFCVEKEFCINRLPVAYIPDAGPPKQWLSFLDQLLEPPDIVTLQEYMGYCLIPTTIAQKMLFIIGNGGEGKSRVGRVMRSLLGDNMNTGDIHKIEKSQFARADLEWKLLLLDDDMNMEALTKTNNIKAIVTLEDKIDLERKGKQSEQGRLYSRFMCFGNGTLESLYDRSEGFFRRQIILNAIERDENRIDDPFLGERLISERESIFLWCIEGLQRLISNNYYFTISEKARDNLEEVRRKAANVIEFSEAKDYVYFEIGTRTTSKNLYRAYRIWCDENVETPVSETSFIKTFKTVATAKHYPIKHNQNIPNEEGRKVRGFDGVHVMIRTNRFI